MPCTWPSAIHSKMLCDSDNVVPHSSGAVVEAWLGQYYERSF